MSVLHHTPSRSTADAARLARALYGIDATVTSLPGERDQNFLLQAGSARYVLKIANATESLAMLEAQNAAMNRASDGAPCQRALPGLDGATVARTESGHFVRVLSWLDGVPLGTLKHPPAGLLRSLGEVMGRISTALDGFDAPAAHRDFHWDVARATREIGAHAQEIADPARRALVLRFRERFARELDPRLPGLPHSVIHGDANDYNVLIAPGDTADPVTRYQEVSGVLDFGDMVYTATVCEPAIAAAYALLDKQDPLAAAAAVVAGYHAAHPLGAAEVEVLWDLICARLCMSVCHAARQSAMRPDDAYLSISERPAWAALERLEPIHPRLAHYTLRAACGLPACPQTAAVTAHLAGAAARHALGEVVHLGGLRTCPIDLTPGSLMLGNFTPGSSAAEFTRILFGHIAAHGADVGVGGYNEPRLIYAAHEFAAGESPTAERRTVHLGLDLWAAAGTPVHAPLEGRVRAFHNNTARLDYGPVIILEHRTSDGVTFCTKYGHLSLESLDGLAVGQTVAAGQRIGWMGAPPVNGDWPPHVHFQIVVDTLDLDCDFNGVGRASERSVWLSLCPDPNLILGLSADALPADKPALEDTLTERRLRVGRNLSISFMQPLKIVRGLRQYLYDETGRAYLDGVNNVAHVGHAHPRVVQAGQRQMAVLNTNTRYLHDSINELAARLHARLPAHLSVCFFVNSGSEANDLALRLARAASGQFDFICVDAGYHGHTQALIEVSPYKHNGPGGRGRPPFVQMAMLPDPFRGPHKGYTDDTARKYADDVGRCIGAIQAQGRGVAGFICESMIGCGGQVVLPPGYMRDAFTRVQAAGGVCIADEVQVGFGRVGTHFWGFETQDCRPDIVTMGKPFGNGHPLAAVATTPEIAAAFDNGMEYFNTFGGNAVSCEIGKAVLDVIEDEGLQANALRIGNRLIEGARALQQHHTLIGDVRGLGLYLGIELVRDRDTLAPAGAHASWVSNRMKELGVFVSTDGPFHNVLKIKPPIIWGPADADHFLATLDRVLGEDAAQP